MNATKSASVLLETERTSTIEALEEGLDPQDPELGPGWGEEIARRIRAVERGESRLIEGADVAERVRKALRMTDGASIRGGSRTRARGGGRLV